MDKAEQRRHDEALKADEDQKAAAIMSAAGTGVTELDDEAREAAQRVARGNAERLAAENAGTDREQAAGGLVRAGEKFTGVDPIEGDAFAVTQGQEADLVRLGREENERTLAQQKAQADAEKPGAGKTVTTGDTAGLAPVKSAPRSTRGK